MEPIEIPWKTYYYYKNHLSPRDRRIYDAIFEGVRRFAAEIPLGETCTLPEVSRIYTLLRLDCPLFFHLSHSIAVREGQNACLRPTYLMDRVKYQQLYKKVTQFVLSSLQTLKGLQVYKRVKCIHNSIARHVIYHGVEEENSHNVLGAIVYRRAVCESIAMAFKLICDGNHIPCIVVFGHADSTDGENFGSVPNDGKDNHAWNKVCIGGRWYNVDVTFDLGMENPSDNASIKYGYFCRSDQVFAPDHTPSFPVLPSCIQDHSYYRSVGLHVTGSEELTRFVKQQAAAHNTHFTFEYSADSRLDEASIRNTICAALVGSSYRSINTWHRQTLRIVSVRLNTEPLPNG